MDLASHFLGETTTTALQKRIAMPVLVIGTDRFTRSDLAGVACFNYIAATNLSNALAEFSSVKSTRDVFELVAPRALALPHVGAIALAVLGAAFEAKGIGGATPLDAWVKKHHDPEAHHKELLTFGTFKHEAAHADKHARKADKEAAAKPDRDTRARRIRARRGANRLLRAKSA